ncbi:hypothetical protein JCM1841_000286 [Sporobolomyces salmonicolor]
MAPLNLRHLTLVPTPLADVPDPGDHSLVPEILEEANKLLESDLWTDNKTHYGGLVETAVLPVDSVTYQPRAGGEPGSSPTGEASGQGIAWHRRFSRLKAAEYGGYDQWWAALGEQHVEQEKEYVSNLKETIDVGKSAGKKDCWLKLYKLPFGATDRSFMCRVIVCSPSSSSSDKSSSSKGTSSSGTPRTYLSSKPGSREFIVFSLPFTTDPAPSEEKKYVRGTTATCERIREVEGGKEIEWVCASLSTPGGSIPVKLSESKMAASLADGVPPVLDWIRRAHPPHATSSAGTPKTPTAPKVTRDLANPGGGMGRMPAHKFTLEMFQRPVQLRDY